VIDDPGVGGIGAESNRMYFEKATIDADGSTHYWLLYLGFVSTVGTTETSGKWQDTLQKGSLLPVD
jgi:hypothetical protein